MARIALTREQRDLLYSFVPQWHGVAEGPPVPFGDGQRARIVVDSILKTTREGAMDSMEYQIRTACASENMEYNEEQWTVTHLALLNGC